MDRRKILLLILSLAFGVVSWAIGVIISPLWWFPFVALPIAGVAMIQVLALLLFEHRRAVRRQSLPGFGVHLLIRISDLRQERRQYIFDLGLSNQAGAAFFLSASRRFVFLVRDSRGEPYSLEVPAGWLGFPIADPAYFAVEAGTDGIRTVMRAMVNGRILHERTLPFAVDFSGLTMDDMTLGASRDKREHGGFTLGELVFLASTLDSDNARNMAHYMANKWNVPIEPTGQL